MKRFALIYLLALGIFGGVQEHKGDGTTCRPTALKGAPACHCRLLCHYDENGEPDGTFEDPGGATSGTDMSTRCTTYCAKDACFCHLEPDPKDCANKSGGHKE